MKKIDWLYMNLYFDRESYALLLLPKISYWIDKGKLHVGWLFYSIVISFNIRRIW